MNSNHCLVRMPKGEPPLAGWPVMLFLHGFGEHGAAYATQAEIAAKSGYLGIAPSGLVVIRGDRRGWPADELSTTHAYFREVLDDCERDAAINRTRVFLCGFSQGATHAICLVAARPVDYRGAVALSPGDGTPIPRALDPTSCPRPLYLAYGEKEFRVFRKRTQTCATLWRRAKWPCLLESHPGSHHFPADWDRRFGGIVGWLENPAQLQCKRSRLGTDPQF